MRQIESHERLTYTATLNFNCAFLFGAHIIVICNSLYKQQPSPFARLFHGYVKDHARAVFPGNTNPVQAMPGRRLTQKLIRRFRTPINPARAASVCL